MLIYASWLRDEFLFGTQDLDPIAAQEVVNRLTLDGVRVTHQAKVLEERCTKRDTSYDSPMKFEERVHVGRRVGFVRRSRKRGGKLGEMGFVKALD